MSTDQAFIKDNNLLRSLAKGESKAFQTVYKECFPYVNRTVLNMNGQPSDAEDVFHAALLVLYSKAKNEDFKLGCKISTFLVAVARNKWLKELEKQKKLSDKEKNYALLHQNEQASTQFDMNKINEEENLRNKLKEALEKLGSPCSEIITSYYIKDMSMKDIAQNFNYTNAENAKTQKHKCLKRLKKIFFT